MPSKYLVSAGSNARGQLATGSTDDAHTFTRSSFEDSPLMLPSDTIKVVDIACGSNFTLLLLHRASSSGTRVELWASGDGSRGQLGPAHYRSEPILVFTQVDLHLSDYGLGPYSVHSVTAGWETSYAVLTSPEEDDVLISFGGNDFGDLGVGHARSSPTDAGRMHIVDLKMVAGGQATSTLKIDIVVAGTHHVVAQVSTTCSGVSESAIVGWGTCRQGQLGFVPPSVVVQPSPSLIQGLEREPMSAVATGSKHTVFLPPSGRLRGLGSNRKKQLENLGSIVGASFVGCTWNGTYTIVNSPNSWSILVVGDDAKGQLGCNIAVDQQSDGPQTVRFPFSHDTHKLLKVACGSEHVLCLFTVAGGGEVWAWGWNEHGNLGLGHTDDVRLPVKIWPNSDENILQRPLDVWAGCGTSWILVEDATT